MITPIRHTRGSKRSLPCFYFVQSTRLNKYQPSIFRRAPLVLGGVTQWYEWRIRAPEKSKFDHPCKSGSKNLTTHVRNGNFFTTHVSSFKTKYQLMLKKKAKFPLRMTQFVHLWTKAVYFGTISCNFIHVIVEKNVCLRKYDHPCKFWVLKKGPTGM